MVVFGLSIRELHIKEKERDGEKHGRDEGKDRKEGNGARVIDRDKDSPVAAKMIHPIGVVLRQNISVLHYGTFGQNGTVQKDRTEQEKEQ